MRETPRGIDFNFQGLNSNMNSVVPTKAFPQVVPPRFGPGRINCSRGDEGEGDWREGGVGECKGEVKGRECASDIGGFASSNNLLTSVHKTRRLGR